MTSETEHPDGARTPNTKPLPKVLWTLWLQGWDRAPQLARRCLANMRRANPGWRVEALDRDSLADHLPASTIAYLDTLPVIPNGYSDVVRLLLLQRHGGVWLDATGLCAVPLDGWVHEVTREGFFAFARPGPDREIATWFLAAHPGGSADGSVIDALAAGSIGHWSHDRESYDYFWVHQLFAMLATHDPGTNARWARTPKVSAAHRFHYGPKAVRLLSPPTGRDIEALAAPPAPVFKLSYKPDGLEGGERVPAGSLIDHLLDLDPLDASRESAVRRSVDDWRTA